GKQLHNLLLFRQGLQQLLQPLAVLLSADQIGRAFQVHRLARFIGSQCAFAVELLDRAHQTVVLAALTLDAFGQLRPQRLHRPSAEILVDIAGGRLQFNVRERRLHAQHAIPHHARTRHYHRQHLLITQSREVTCSSAFCFTPPATATPTWCEITDSTRDVRSMNSCTSLTPCSISSIVPWSCGASRARPLIFST